jgi:hypothetical protein
MMDETRASYANCPRSTNIPTKRLATTFVLDIALTGSAYFAEYHSETILPPRTTICESAPVAAHSRTCRSSASWNSPDEAGPTCQKPSAFDCEKGGLMSVDIDCPGFGALAQDAPSKAAQLKAKKQPFTLAS